MGNDLDNSPTRRYLVVSSAVFNRKLSLEVDGGWLRKVLRQKTLWTPDLRALSELWRFSERQGVRLELAFVGDDTKDAPELWEMIDEGAANPFSDWHAFEQHDAITRMLPFRPDILGIIDTPSRVLMYGGKGLQVGSLR